MRHAIVVAALPFVLLLAGRLPAQSGGDSVNVFGPRPALSLSAGIAQFDLSGTGTTSIIALRGEYPLVPALLVEGGVAIARPDQQFGIDGTLLMPEVQLQLQLPKRVAPYIGIGTGFAHDGAVARYGGDANRITFAGAAGLRAAMTRQAGVRAELRVRYFGTGFNGTTADWTFGFSWRL
ncbi:MAG TPA: outer membrane beta-barrel protein [Gemmatimonadaceae bacterium]|nr:outer membrane beta-barrel protein [Gemmatimonadaceae bacterium]